MSAPHLFCFGLGYSALALGRRLAAAGLVGERHLPRAPKGRPRCAQAGFSVRSVRSRPPAADTSALDGVTHLLVSVPPDAAGDPVLATARRRHRRRCRRLPGSAICRRPASMAIAAAAGSTRPRRCRPTGERGRRRVAAEQGWLDLWHDRGVPVHIFRLAAIYGPGRSAFDALRAGTARRIDKPGQVFSRIHVEDLASVLIASMERPRPGAVYNVCDDDPAPPAAVVAHAAALLGIAAAAARAARCRRAFADGAQLLRRQQARREPA